MLQRRITEPEKKIVAAKQGWKCSSCGDLLPAAFQVDHTVPLCDGGADDIETNCTAMCPNCHCAKTQKEGIERRKKAQQNVPAYEDRLDIFVSKTLVKCSLCGRVRDASVGHDVCLAIESPNLHAYALRERLAHYAFVPRTTRP